LDAFVEVPELAPWVEELDYRGMARRVAFWWQPMTGALAWRDSNEAEAISPAHNSAWREAFAPAFLAASFDFEGDVVLIWDRHDRRVWIAPRVAGLEFVAQACRYDGVT
jgi:hypothetical protein